MTERHFDPAAQILLSFPFQGFIFCVSRQENLTHSISRVREQQKIIVSIAWLQHKKTNIDHRHETSPFVLVFKLELMHKHLNF